MPSPSPEPSALVVRKGSKISESSARGMPGPLSTTERITPSEDSRVRTISRRSAPRLESACSALTMRLSTTCSSAPGSPITAERPVSKSRRTSMPAVCSAYCCSESTRSVMVLRFTGSRPPAPCCRAKESMLSTIAATRVLSWMMISSACRCSSPAASRTSSCAKLLMEASGLLTSCATPAASSPTAASRSERLRRSSAFSISLRSSTQAIPHRRPPYPPRAAAGRRVARPRRPPRAPAAWPRPARGSRRSCRRGTARRRRSPPAAAPIRGRSRAPAAPRANARNARPPPHSHAAPYRRTPAADPAWGARPPRSGAG